MNSTLSLARSTLQPNLEMSKHQARKSPQIEEKRLKRMKNKEIVKELKEIKDCIGIFSNGTVLSLINELINKIEK